MDRYPHFQDPKPLVCVIGNVENEPDAHSRIIAGLECTMPGVDVSSDRNDVFPLLNIRSVPADHVFKDKKPPKDAPSIDGIIKNNWLQKHTETIPSVVIFLTAFCIDWTSNEWVNREAIIQEKYYKLKGILALRDAKVLLVAMKTGQGVIDKDVIDERQNSMKRHLQLDGKSFFYLTTAGDFSAGSLFMKKLCKAVKEMSCQYYSSQCKRFKVTEKAMVGNRTSMDSLLTARYNFKCAYFYELQGLKSSALKSYRLCFQSLLDAVDAADNDMMDQVKAVADYCNFKICSLLMKPLGNVREAAAQFGSLIHKFLKTSSTAQWRHYAWLCDQYLMFSTLLEQSEVDDGNVDADRSFYLLNAAKCASTRWASFLRARASKLTGPTVSARPDLIFGSPRYLGSAPVIVHIGMDTAPPSEEEAEALIREHYESLELVVQHGAMVMQLLQSAHQKIDICHSRRRAQVRVLMAEQYIAQGDYQQALACISPAAEVLATDGWVGSAVPVLRRKMLCALHLGRAADYLLTAVTLYATTMHTNFLDKHEKVELHWEIMSLLSPPQHSGEASNNSSNNHTDSVLRLPSVSAVRVVNKESYGSAATADHPAEHELPQDYTVALSDMLALFDVKVSFSQCRADVGQTIRIRLMVKSEFVERISFSSMSVHFTNDCSVKVFTQDSTAGVGGDCEAGAVLAPGDLSASSPAVLVFPPQRYVTFVYSVLVTEACLLASPGTGSSSSSASDPMICVQKLLFTMASTPISSSTSSSSATGASATGASKAVHLVVNLLPESLLRAQDSQQRPMTLKEICQFMRPGGAGAHVMCRRPSLLEIARPTADASLVSPKEPIVTLLQGPLQRINVVFRKHGNNSLRNGRVYLACDYMPSHITNAFFWYPDTDTASSSGGASVKPPHVTFNPIVLNGSMQPSQALLIPNQEPNAMFCVPLFVRCEMLGTYKIKLRLEYIPKAGVSTPVSKEFEIKVNFVRPLLINFNLNSHREAQCGVVRDASSTTVLQGDTIAVSTSITCLEGLGSSVDLLGLSLHPADSPVLVPSAATAGIAVSPIKYFHINSVSTEDNLLCHAKHTTPSTSISTSSPVSVSDVGEEVVRLKKGEIYTRTAEVYCVPAPVHLRPVVMTNQMNLSAERVRASMGDVYVDWRVSKDCLMAPCDLKQFMTTGGDLAQSTVADKNCIIKGNNTDLSWLNKLDRCGVSEAAVSVVDKSVVVSDTCSMIFSIPPVEMVSAPFDVTVSSPSCAALGQEIKIIFTLVNQLCSLERVVLKATLNMDYLVCGPTAVVYELSPLGNLDVEFSLVPLKCGQIALPHVVIAWERTGVNIVDVGSNVSPRYMFIRPC